MNCNMVRVEGPVFACANAGCARIFKYIGNKEPPASRCRGCEIGSVVPSDVLERAREIAGQLVEAEQSQEDGPGSQLRLILSELGIDPTGECPCSETQTKMNRLGVDGCLAGVDEICAEVFSNAKKWLLIFDGETGALRQRIPVHAGQAAQ